MLPVPFASNTKFDGNTDDSSGNNNHAIAIADISSVPNYKGEPNKALIFDPRIPNSVGNIASIVLLP